MVPILGRSTLADALLPCGLAMALLAVAGTGAPGRLRAEALLVTDVNSGKVLISENATTPWYPASVTKLMTTYVTLKALRDGRIGLDTLFTVSPDAAAQQPSKMGFKVGIQLTVDNTLKMMLVHSANDMAVVLAEGVSGSIEKFADEMNAEAARLGMTQTSYVNPNGLPDDQQITSARDLAILARALIREFPEYDYLWHIASIRLGKRIYRNTNRLIDAYPGSDGMKTGFICASGFNLVATATRGDKRIIAVVLGAPSSAARANKAAQLLERGFAANPLTWFLRSETVDQLVPVAIDPPNLRDDICGPKRRRAPAEDADEDATSAGGASGDAAGQHTFTLSSIGGGPLRPTSLLTSGLAAAIPPVEVYVGPARQPGDVVTNEPDPFPPTPAKKKPGTTIIAAKPPPGSPGKPGNAAKPAAAKPAKPSAKPAADAAPAEPLPQSIVVLKPWPGETPANAKPSTGETPTAGTPAAGTPRAATKPKPAVATVAKPKPTIATAPKTETQ
jgi:D-alanyl-D-alanine carboxypeptidase